MSKVLGHALIQRIMNVANVLIESEYKTSQVREKYPRVDVKLPSPTLAPEHMAHDGDGESFPHKLNKGNIFIIETSVSACDRTIASISKSIVYNSRANFILLLSQDGNKTMAGRTGVVVDGGGDETTTHSCENEIKSANHSHCDEQCDTVASTLNNVTNPAGVDRKINDEKMIDGTLKHVFRLLWTRHIFNAVIMLCETIDTATATRTKSSSSSSSSSPTETVTNSCAFYTWFPFDESSECGRTVEHFVKIDECVYDKNRNRLQFHYSAENKWYFGVSDGDEQGQINNRRLRRTEPNYANNDNGHAPPSRRNANHVPNENEVVVGTAPFTYAYTFRMDKNFNKNTSLFSMNTANGEFEMKIGNTSSAVDTIEQSNLCVWNALNPSVRLFVINDTQPNRERMQNREFAKNYFKYECREFATIEFRNNRIDGDRFTKPTHGMPTMVTNATMTDAKTTRSPSIIKRIISNRHRPHFYEKIPSDLLGCVYDALVFVWPPFVTPVTAAFYGLEHKLLLDVARHMNYRMNETSVQYGNTSQDGRKTTYSYAVLVNSTASLAFGNIYPIANMQNKFDASIGYLFDHVNWAVPLAATAPAWLNLFNCFR